MGQIVEVELQNLHRYYENVYVDVFTVMPNHIHAIIAIENEKEKVQLPTIVGLLKSGITKKICKIQLNTEVWQRSFHDHVIRSQSSYEKIYSYIQFNPQKWEQDCFYPQE